MMNDVDLRDDLPRPDGPEELLDGGETAGPEAPGEVAGEEEEAAAGVGEPEAGDGVAELEALVAVRDEEIAGLKEAVAELEGRLSTAGASLSQAVVSYRRQVLKANPDVMEELVSGDTITAVDESLKQAKSLIGRVRQGLEAESSLARVPAGAPGRRAPDMSDLSPREKIQYAIGGKR